MSRFVLPCSYLKQECPLNYENVKEVPCWTLYYNFPIPGKQVVCKKKHSDWRKGYYLKGVTPTECCVQQSLDTDEQKECEDKGYTPNSDRCDQYMIQRCYASPSRGDVACDTYRSRSSNFPIYRPIPHYNYFNPWWPQYYYQ